MTRGNKSHHRRNKGEGIALSLGLDNLHSASASSVLGTAGFTSQANDSICHVITSLASFHCSRSTKEEPLHLPLPHQEGWRKLTLEGRLRRREGSSLRLFNCAPKLSRVVEKKICSKTQANDQLPSGSEG